MQVAAVWKHGGALIWCEHVRYCHGKSVPARLSASVTRWYCCIETNTHRQTLYTFGYKIPRELPPSGDVK